MILMPGDERRTVVKPAYDNFVQPTSRHADIVGRLAMLRLIRSRTLHEIVPGSDNEVAIDLISTHIRRQLTDRARSFRPQMVPRPSHTLHSIHVLEENPNFIIIPQTSQLKVLSALVGTNWMQL